MKAYLFVLVFLSTALFTRQSYAQASDEYETVIVEQNFNSSSKIVIDKKEIERSHAKDIPTLLATQANISISQSNVQPNSIFLRGGDSSHILILVDGVPFYDPTTVQRTINLGSLNLKSVQRMEVLKGSQSVLYGGQALAGVIKIETIPQVIKNSGQLLLQKGTQNQSMGALNGVLALDENVAIVARGSYSNQDSKSPVLDSTQTYPTSLSTGELAYVDRSRPLEVLLKLQTSFDQTQISDSDFVTYKALDATDFNTSTYQLNGTGVFTFPSSILKPMFSFSHQNSARLFQQDTTTKREYNGQLLATRFELTPYADALLSLRLGISYTKEAMSYANMGIPEVDADTEYESIFLKAVLNPLSWMDIEIGGRTDFQKMENSVNTGHFGLIFLKSIKLEASTGFKNPSLFQLYSDYGNADLKPEKSTSYSVSYDNSYYENQISTSATIFVTRFSNLIIARGSPLKYNNIQSSETKGIELMVGYRPLDTGFSSQLSLGYQEPRDLDLNNWLPKRPLRTASLKVRQEVKSVGLGLEVVHGGERRDKSGQVSYISLDPYTVVNTTVDYGFTSALTAFLRLQNITNQRYETSYTYYNEGFSGYAGIEFGF